MTYQLSIGKHGYTVVDADVGPEILTHTWSLDISTGYVYRLIKNGLTQKKVYLHRIISNPKEGEVVDHSDRDKLNNTRSNLRNVSHSVNMRNTAPSGEVPYKGVYKKRNKFGARIRYRGEYLSLGDYFGSPEEAAHTYNIAANSLYGGYAVLNPVEGCFTESEKSGKYLEMCGVKLTTAAWSRVLDINAKTLYTRKSRGWSDEECILGKKGVTLALALRTLESDFDTEMRINIEKLQARFPSKFTEQDAEFRDLQKERQILEQG